MEDLEGRTVRVGLLGGLAGATGILLTGRLNAIQARLPAGAKTELNLAMHQLYRALGQPSTIGDEDKKGARSAYQPVVESPEDKALPPEQHELHVANRHATLAREALKGSKDAGQHRAEAADQVEQALAHLQKALGQPGTAKGAETDPRAPSAKTE